MVRKQEVGLSLPPQEADIQLWLEQVCDGGWRVLDTRIEAAGKHLHFLHA